jgi:hypothetical protein
MHWFFFEKILMCSVVQWSFGAADFEDSKRARKLYILLIITVQECIFVFCR